MATPLFSIGGLVSGLDTNAIIKQLMDLERVPIARLQARQAAYRAKVDAWASVTTRLSALRSAVNGLRSVEDLRGYVAATSSAPSVVEATAVGAADPAALSFTVDRLATRHQVIAQPSFGSGSAVVGAGTLTITRGSASYQVTTDAGTTLDQLAAAINALDAGVRASVVAVDGANVRLVLAAQDTGAAAAFTVGATQPTLTGFDVLEQGVDAQLTIGSGAGALTVTRSSNTIEDLLSGVRLTLRGTGSVTVSVERDVDGVVSAVKRLVDELNKTLSTLGNLTRYDPEGKSAGPLQGDRAAWQLALDLRAAFSDAVTGASGSYRAVSGIGITLTREGTFRLDEAALRTALREDPTSVERLLGRSGTASDPRLSFVAASDQTRPGAYAVVLTRAAEVPSVTGSVYVAPVADESFDISVGSTSVTVTVGAGSTLEQAVASINAALAAGGLRTVSATIVGGDRIGLVGTRYGAASTFTVTGGASFGLEGTFHGEDAAGTIDGVAASGTGQVLVASSGSAQGLRLRVSATAAEVAAAGGSLALGGLTYVEGAVGRLSRLLATAEGAGGLVASATDRWRSQIRLIDEEVRKLQQRLDLREATLRRQFSAMETALSGLSAQANWLAAQLAGMSGGSS
jgi:flagellar hook-associated protein 2